MRSRADFRRTAARWTMALALAGGVSVGAWPTSAAGQEADSATVAELERRIEAITRELERLRLGSDVVEADTSILGFGPAASKVYKVGGGVSLGGYGEVLYNRFAEEREDGEASGKVDRLDALRAIVYVGYKFTDRLLFNSEIEFEHASTGKAGEVSMEFAYLDYLLDDDVGLRAGLLLAPMGFINELHEPPVFLGTTRPLTERRIIPTTWRDNGIGLFGRTDALEWRAYVMNALDGVGGGPSKAGGFGPSGLRSGRQQGSEAVAEDLALVGRVDYVGTLGLTVGGSAYFGESAHDRVLDGEEVGGGTLIWEGHVDWDRGGLALRGLVAGAHLNDASSLNALRGASSSVGESLLGWYAEAGYDVLRGRDTRHALLPFVRYEWIDTHRSVPDGFTEDPAQQDRVLMLGAVWKPIPQVVWKAAYSLHSNGADRGVDQLDLAVGYLF